MKGRKMEKEGKNGKEGKGCSGRFGDAKIQDILLNIGIPANIYGFLYITYALQLLDQDPEYMYHVTKYLYVSIAKKFKTTPSSVERSIRHAISVGWLKGDIEYTNRMFKNSVNSKKGVPTNSQFLARLYYYIKNLDDGTRTA